MKNIKKVIVILSIIILSTTFLSLKDTRFKETINYQDIIRKLDDKYLGNYEEIINNLGKELENNKYKDELKIFFELYYNYEKGNYEFVTQNSDKVEQALKDVNLDEELLELYSILSNVSMGYSNYETAYIYMEKGELICNKLLDKYTKSKEKDLYDETESILMAIKYVKVTVLLDLGLEELADKNFAEVELLSKKLDIRDRMDIYSNKFTYYYEKNDYKNAKKIYETMEKIETNNNETNELVKIKSLAELSRLQIKNNRIDEAVKNAKYIFNMEINLSGNTKMNELLLYSDICKYYDEIDKSIYYAEEAYELSKKSKHRYQVEILQQIISLYKEKGDVPKKYYELYIELHDMEDDDKSMQFLLGKNIDLEVESMKEKESNMKLRETNTIIASTSLTLLILIIALRILRDNFQDSLTKINNRKIFDIKYKKVLKSSSNYYIVMIDIDNFKSLNDNHGHEFGDIVLASIARRIRHTIKDYKASVYRYGGEEFVILIKRDENEEDDVFRMCQKVLKTVSNLKWDNVDRVTVSMGVANVKKHKQDAFKVADDNLYKAKKSGKNQVVM